MSNVAPACTHALDVLAADRRAVGADELRRARLHAATCPTCSRTMHDPEASERVLSSLASQRLDPPLLLRIVLAVLAAVQLVFAIPWLFGATLLPDHYVAISHLTRDGALGLVIASAGILVAWRPRYAMTALLVGSIVLVAQATLGVVDQHNHSVNTAFELLHVLVLLILGLIAIASTATRRSAPTGQQSPHRLRSL